MRGRILVVEDKDTMRLLLERVLSERHEVASCESGSEALAVLGREPFDVVLTAVRLPGADGFEILEAVRAAAPDTEVVMMTAYATIERAVEAMKKGAYDYLQKPFEPDDALRVVERALERKRLREQAQQLRAALRGVQKLDRLIGKSPAMQEVFDLIQRAAELELTVLITGESGTGKELAARAIHGRGQRASRPFVALNCGALPPELVESELFGHVKGAFTGATGARPGAFVEADGGTLFLDEIGELPLPAQVKLTRVLQEREVRPVGASSTRAVDVRVVAATLRDLKEEVAAGRFREDLFYRLNVFPIPMPPLRERSGDVAILAAHFLEKHARRQSRTVESLAPEALALIAGYPFPGNVRELENVIERAVALAPGTEIAPACLPAELREAPRGVPGDKLAGMTFKEAVNLARDRGSREYLIALMEAFGGNVTKAAEQAGVERESLHRLLKKHGLRADRFRVDGGEEA